MTDPRFTSDFHWGVATSAYQIEASLGKPHRTGSIGNMDNARLQSMGLQLVNKSTQAAQLFFGGRGVLSSGVVQVRTQPRQVQSVMSH